MVRLLLIQFVFILCSLHLLEAQNVYNVSNEQFKLSWLTPQTNSKSVGKYEKLEFGARLNTAVNNKINQFIENNKSGLNPYNPDDISVEMTFVSPSYKEKTIFGFYYQEVTRAGEKWNVKETDLNWRIRFSPDEIGKWKFTIKIYVQGEEIASIGSKFKCIESQNKGVIKRNYKGDDTDRYFYLSETNETFFTLGHNIGHSAYYKLTPKKADQHMIWLTELAKNGGNFFRLEMGAQNALPDWNNHIDYTSKMAEMWEFDKLTEHAKSLGLYFILFRHHTEVKKGPEWEVARWSNNPYKSGFNLKNREEYFTNNEVMKWQKNALRYLFSRWGYNSSFAFYEYQEVDNWIEDLQKETGYSDQKAIELFTKWYLPQKKFIKEELGSDKLFINTYASTPDYEYKKSSNGMFANSDAIGFHKYGQGKEINYKDRYEKAVKLYDVWNKPIFVEEMGVDAYGTSNYLPIYKCSNSEFHNSLWSTSFMGLAGSGMTWWWDRGIHDFEYYKDYKALSFFFNGEKLEDERYSPQQWHSKISIKRATIESYALKNKANTKVLGWVHNASHYWRNINSDCLNELLKDGKFTTPHKLKDGYVIGDIKNNERTDFSKHGDAYSNKGGIQNVASQLFEIKGLNSSSMFAKKEWYKVTFYSTETNAEKVSDITNTNIWGKLKLKYPEENASDYSYKIVYLGNGKKNKFKK